MNIETKEKTPSTLLLEIKELRPKLEAFESQEIKFFGKIAQAHLGPGDDLLKQLEEHIEFLIKDHTKETMEEVEKTLEKWYEFLDLKDRFYKYVLDDSFGKITWNEKGCTCEEGAEQLMNVCVQSLLDIVSAGLKNETMRTHVLKETKSHAEKRVVVMPIHEYDDAYVELVRYVFSPSSSNDHEARTRIMTFDRSMIGSLLSYRIGLANKSYLRNVTNKIFRDFRRQYHIPRNAVVVSIDDTTLDDDNEHAKQEKLLKEIDDILAFRNGSPSESRIALAYSHLYFIYDILSKSNCKQLESWLLRKGVAVLRDESKDNTEDESDENDRGLPAADIVRILACLTQVKKWHDNQCAVELDGKKVVANQEILEWTDPNITLHVNEAVNNINKLDFYLWNLLGEYDGCERSPFFQYLTIHMLDTRIELPLYKNNSLYENFVNFTKTHQDTMAIFRDRADDMQIAGCLMKYKGQRRMIHDHFSQLDESVAEMQEKYKNCLVCKDIEDVPGLSRMCREKVYIRH